jgi:hypothetical protein
MQFLHQGIVVRDQVQIGPVAILCNAEGGKTSASRFDTLKMPKAIREIQ